MLPATNDIEASHRSLAIIEGLRVAVVWRALGRGVVLGRGNATSDALPGITIGERGVVRLYDDDMLAIVGAGWARIVGSSRKCNSRKDMLAIGVKITNLESSRLTDTPRTMRIDISRAAAWGGVVGDGRERKLGDGDGLWCGRRRDAAIWVKCIALSNWIGTDQSKQVEEREEDEHRYGEAFEDEDVGTIDEHREEENEYHLLIPECGTSAILAYVDA